VFAVSFSFISPTADRGALGERIALLSSRNGALLRWLTPRQDGTFDAALSVQDGWIYCSRGVASVSIWRVRIAGGRARLVRPGAAGCAVCPDAGHAVSPDGRAVADVISADHGDVLELVARNLATGRQNTTMIATRPSPDANNWPPGISSLTRAPADAHLVFGAFTAATLGDSRIAPSTCTLTGNPNARSSIRPTWPAARSPTSSSGSLAAEPPVPAWWRGRRPDDLVLLPHRAIPVLRHYLAGTGDLGRLPGRAEGALNDLALVRRRSGRDRRAPAAGRVAVRRGRGDRLVRLPSASAGCRRCPAQPGDLRATRGLSWPKVRRRPS
jgi:hypothetical protein